MTTIRGRARLRVALLEVVSVRVGPGTLLRRESEVTEIVVVGPSATRYAGNYRYPENMAIQPDGNIMVGGTSLDVNSPAHPNYDFVLVRFLGSDAPVALQAGSVAHQAGVHNLRTDQIGPLLTEARARWRS